MEGSKRFRENPKIGRKSWKSHIPVCMRLPNIWNDQKEFNAGFGIRKKNTALTETKRNLQPYTNASQDGWAQGSCLWQRCPSSSSIGGALSDLPWGALDRRRCWSSGAWESSAARSSPPEDSCRSWWSVGGNVIARTEVCKLETLWSNGLGCPDMRSKEGHSLGHLVCLRTSCFVLCYKIFILGQRDLHFMKAQLAEAQADQGLKIPV